MIREIDLLSYLPQFIQQYREIKQITGVEAPLLQQLADETEIVKNNQFILTCDEIGIRKFEKLLKIAPLKDDSLQSRRLRVLMRWNNDIPYTYKVLLKKLDEICGDGNYESIPDFNNYALEIITNLTQYGQIEEVEHLLNYMVPANIGMTVKNNIYIQASGNIFMASAHIGTKMYTYSTGIEKYLKLKLPVAATTAIVMSTWYTVTDEFNDIIEQTAAHFKDVNTSITSIITVEKKGDNNNG